MQKKLVAVSLIFTLLLSFSACGGIVKKEKTESKTKTEAFALEDVSVLKVDEDTQTVRIIPSKLDEISVSYPDNGTKEYDVTLKDGTLKIVGKTIRSLIGVYQNLVIAIPEAYVGSLYAEVTTGDCIITADAAFSSVELKVYSGRIATSALNAQNIDLSVSVGTVSGTLLGEETDYSIEAGCKIGTNSLTERTGEKGGKTLSVEVGTGSIELQFEK